MTPEQLSGHFPTFDPDSGWVCWCGWTIPTGPRHKSRHLWALHVLAAEGLHQQLWETRSSPSRKLVR